MRRARASASRLLAELKACSTARDLRRGKQLHADAIASGEDADIFVASTLVCMYAKCGSIAEAHQVFDRMSNQDTVAWNALISGYADNGDGKTALELLSRMESASVAPDALTFVAALKACTDLAEKEEGELVDGKLVKSASRERGILIHSAISKCRFESHIFVANSLVNMYAKCGSLDLARQIFESTLRRDAVSWNALIFGYANNGEGELALDLISRMESEGCRPNARTFVAAVRACMDLASSEDAVKVHGKPVKLKSLEKLRVIHARAVKAGFRSHPHFLSALVDLYAKCGSLEDAQMALLEAQTADIVPWNALLFRHVDNGESWRVVQLFERMLLEGCVPNALSFVAALKACASKEVDRRILAKGFSVHAQATSCGYEADIRVANSLIDLYKKSGSMVQARQVFDGMKQRDVKSWTALILGYAETGQKDEALELFSRMDGEEVLPDIVIWNALIGAFAETGEGVVALELFSRLERQGLAYNAVSFVGALKACIHLAEKEEASTLNGKLVKVSSREKGVAVHSKAVECSYDSHEFVASALVDMYAKCGCISEARGVFDAMKQRDVVSWTSMIMGHADNGEGEAALGLFARMKREGCEQDGLCFVAAVKACADIATKEEAQDAAGVLVKPMALRRGLAIHTEATRRNFDSQMFLASTLVDMYGKCGRMERAHRVFETIRNPDVVAWTALIMGYAENGEERRAMELFSAMKRQGCAPNSLTYAAALRACVAQGGLGTGKQLHSELRAAGLENDPGVVSALVYFYGKCGSMDEARRAFDNPKAKKNLITWNALMTGYSHLGDTFSVFDLFDKLCTCPDLRPDHITFLCVLSTCSHAGLVDSAEGYFESMASRFEVTPNVDHYTCMVDMLGRANRLGDALALVRGMPMSPDSVTWTSVLGACRQWQNQQLGQLAFDTLLSLDVTNSGAFALMSNMERSK